MRKFWILGLVGLVVTCGGPEGEVFDLEQVGEMAQEEWVSPSGLPGVKGILVKFREGVSEEKIQQVLERVRGKEFSRIEQLKVKVWEVPAEVWDNALLDLRRMAEVEYAEPDYPIRAVFTPNDTYFSLQWGLHNTGQKVGSCLAAGAADADIDAPEAWDITQGSSSVRVAILDTGIQSKHPDLNGKVVLKKNFSSSRTVEDRHGHGTHTAGIASAMTNNARGVAGTGFQVVLMNGKVLNDAGSGTVSASAKGIIWAADNDAKAINMSYGSSYRSQTEQDAVNYAWGKGVVLVGAAGNSNTTTKFYPAGHDNVISVAATDNNDRKASFSNYGNWVHIASPGVCIASTYKNNSYAYMSGTSMSSPFVAGTAGLVFSLFPSATNAEVRDRILNSADPIPGTGTYWIYGRLNGQKALQ